MTGSGISLQWHGAAHYRIRYGGLEIYLDPLFTRLPGDEPHLAVTRDDPERIDHLLLTHGHLDHSWDVPYLVAKHRPEVRAPGACLRDVQREAARSAVALDMEKCHPLESSKGKAFAIADIEVTPYQIGTEEIDFWFVRSMCWRPRAIPAGIRWATHHLFGSCFAFHFRFPFRETTLLYFGNLSEQVREMGGIERVDVLAIPYCPANRKWLWQSQRLIERFRPAVTLVHHFDNFLNPYTSPRYMDLGAYRKALGERCPGARFYFSKFLRPVDLAEIVGS